MRKHKIKIYLKSGSVIQFKCNHFEWERSGNEIRSYKFNGGYWDAPDYIKIEQIDAIVTQPTWHRRPWLTIKRLFSLLISTRG